MTDIRLPLIGPGVDSPDYSVDITNLNDENTALQTDLDNADIALDALEANIEVTESAIELKADKEHTHLKSDFTDILGGTPNITASGPVALFKFLTDNYSWGDSKFVDLKSGSTSTLFNDNVVDKFIELTNTGFIVKSPCSLLIVLNTSEPDSSTTLYDMIHGGPSLRLLKNSVDFGKRLHYTLHGIKNDEIQIQMLKTPLSALRDQHAMNVFVSVVVIPSVIL